MKGESVFNTVRTLMEKGMDLSQAIEEVEKALRGKLPEHVVSLIRQEIELRSLLRRE